MNTPRTPCSPRPAFTLIELTLVLVVIAIAISVVAPQFRGYNRGTRLRDAADQFVTLTRLARTRAVANAQPHRIVFDAANRRCVVAVQVGQQYEQIPGTQHDDAVLPFPDGVTIRLTDAPGVGGVGATRDFIDFLPSGRAQAARVRVAGDDGGFVDIEALSPTEAFHALRTGEGSK